MNRSVVRGLAGQKGGGMTSIIAVAESADQVTDRVIAIAELVSGGLHRLVIDKDGTEDLVLTMTGFGRSEEEVMVARFVHGATSLSVGDFSPGCVPQASGGRETSWERNEHRRLGIPDFPGAGTGSLVAG